MYRLLVGCDCIARICSDRKLVIVCNRHVERCETILISSSDELVSPNELGDVEESDSFIAIRYNDEAMNYRKFKMKIG